MLWIGGYTSFVLAETKVLICVASGSYGKRIQAFDLDLTRGTITTRIGDAYSGVQTYQATITQASVRWSDGTERSIDRQTGVYANVIDGRWVGSDYVCSAAESPKF